MIQTSESTVAEVLAVAVTFTALLIFIYIHVWSDMSLLLSLSLLLWWLTALLLNKREGSPFQKFLRGVYRLNPHCLFSFKRPVTRSPHSTAQHFTRNPHNPPPAFPPFLTPLRFTRFFRTISMALWFNPRNPRTKHTFAWGPQNRQNSRSKSRPPHFTSRKRPHCPFCYRHIITIYPYPPIRSFNRALFWNRCRYADQEGSSTTRKNWAKKYALSNCIRLIESTNPTTFYTKDQWGIEHRCYQICHRAINLGSLPWSCSISPYQYPTQS